MIGNDFLSCTLTVGMCTFAICTPRDGSMAVVGEDGGREIWEIALRLVEVEGGSSQNILEGIESFLSHFNEHGKISSICVIFIRSISLKHSIVRLLYWWSPCQ